MKQKLNNIDTTVLKVFLVLTNSKILKKPLGLQTGVGLLPSVPRPVMQALRTNQAAGPVQPGHGGSTNSDMFRNHTFIYTPKSFKMPSTPKVG